MELYLDTANVAEVERLARIFPIAGVTTNPEHYRCQQGVHLGSAAAPAKAIGDEGILFAQTMSRDAQEWWKKRSACATPFRALWLKSR